MTGVQTCALPISPAIQRTPRPVPAPSAPRPRPPAASAGASRPLTITVLAVLWMLSIPIYGVGGLALAHGLGWTGAWAALPVGLGLILTVISGVMAYGLWALAPWARVAQIVLAAIGRASCRERVFRVV